MIGNCWVFIAHLSIKQKATVIRAEVSGTSSMADTSARMKLSFIGMAARYLLVAPVYQSVVNIIVIIFFYKKLLKTILRNTLQKI